MSVGRCGVVGGDGGGGGVDGGAGAGEGGYQEARSVCLVVVVVRWLLEKVVEGLASMTRDKYDT